jgi:hypothetical protein
MSMGSGAATWHSQTVIGMISVRDAHCLSSHLQAAVVSIS